LYYEIRMKGQFSQDWANISSTQANHQSEYTELTYALAGNNASGHFDSSLNEISSGGTADFQVQAQIGYIKGIGISLGMGSSYEFTGQTSGWSNTQTITIGEAAQAPSPSETAPTTQNSPATSAAIPETSPAISTLSQSPHFTPSPLATQQTQPEPTQTQPAKDQSSLLPYVLVVVAAVLVAFVGGALFSRSRYKKPNAQ
jgi:hypothetical protein